MIAAVASLTGAYYVLLPELGALSWDVMGQPGGRWASSPVLLALTPVLTGVVGTVVTRTMPYGFFSILITVIVCVAIIRTLRSPVAPAISAGLLPLVLGVTSWWYPPGVLFGTTLLAVISIPWRRYATSTELNGPQVGTAADDQSSDARAIAPAGAACTPARSTDGPRPSSRVMPVLLAFVAIAIVAVKVTGMRFILFPPLVVILYEMLSHPAHCRWIGRPIALPAACFLSAAGGYFFCTHMAFVPLAAMLSMAWGVAVLRALNLHMPPALAVALLPMVMNQPTAGYPIAVGLGTTLASTWFVLFEKWCESR